MTDRHIYSEMSTDRDPDIWPWTLDEVPERLSVGEGLIIFGFTTIALGFVGLAYVGGLIVLHVLAG